MNKAYWIALIFIIGFISCKRKATETEVSVQQDTIAAPVEKEVAGDCYLFYSGQDTIVMQIVVENTSVAGQLHYRFFEKDKSSGTLFGNMRGDTLIADYKFIAEGTESEREVAFLKTGEAFIEGSGDIEERDGRTVFKDVRTLKFEGQRMPKTNCNELMQYFSK